MLLLTSRPCDHEFRQFRRTAQSKRHDRLVVTQVTIPSGHPSRPLLVAAPDPDLCADGVSFALRAHQLNLQPVIIRLGAID